MSNTTTKQVLAVDLDGTLVRGDTLSACLRCLLRRRPLLLLCLPLWLLQGRAWLKQELARHAGIDPASLNYNPEVLEYVRLARAQGRLTVLATGSDIRVAEAVARHLDCFDEVLASDGHSNRTGHCKADTLVARYGEGGFDYIGNSTVDMAVWERAAGVLVAGGSQRLRNRVAGHFEVLHAFD